MIAEKEMLLREMISCIRGLSGERAGAGKERIYEQNRKDDY